MNESQPARSRTTVCDINARARHAPERFITKKIIQVPY